MVEAGFVVVGGGYGLHFEFNGFVTGGFEGFVMKSTKGSNAEPKVCLTERWRVPLDIEVISPAAVAARRVPMV